MIKINLKQIIILLFAIAIISGCTSNQKDTNEIVEQELERAENTQTKLNCAYGNIMVDKDYTKIDTENNMLQTYIQNKGVSEITITGLTIETEESNPQTITLNLKIEKDKIEQYNLDLSSIGITEPQTITRIIFKTECESVFENLKRPDSGWTTFTYGE